MENSVTKKPILQGGVQNYLGKQKEVKAPIKWKSSPDHPETELAYITKAEKDLLVKQDLHGSLKGGVNRGPSGIMSLNGYGSFDGPDPSQDTGMSGAATSAAEAGGGSGADRRELESNISTDRMTDVQLPPGVTKQLPSDIQDYRSAFITAGGGQRVNPGFFDSKNTISPAELARAKAYARRGDNVFARKAMYNRGGGLMGLFTGGGFLGNIIRNIGQRLGYGKRYNQPTYDMRGLSSINPNYLDIYNEFLDDEDDDTQPNIVSFDNPNNRLLKLPVTNQGLTGTNAYYDSPFARSDFTGQMDNYTNMIENNEPISDDEQMFIDNQIAANRFN